jgi:curved DNA-binding protein CbpA
MDESVDAYKILQVDPEAEDDVVRAAYRRLARKYHPDLAAGPEAANRMTSINAAWNLIGTPDARAGYDRARLPSTSATQTPGGASRQPSDAEASGASTQRSQTGARSAPGDPSAAGGRSAAAQPPPETVSRDWTSGRSTVGGGFDASMRSPEGLGAAGPPPGRPSGSVLNFGRYSGWSLGEIARHDLEYIEWLDRTPIGRTYRDELDALLRAAGRRQSASTEATERRGLFRRR